MIVVVDERELVTRGYASLVRAGGHPLDGFDPEEFGEWVNRSGGDRRQRGGGVPDRPGRAFAGPSTRDPGTLAGSGHRRKRLPSLEMTLALFDSGVDDVVRKPVHPREILARVAAIRRRLTTLANHSDSGAIRVFSDGRDPEVAGEVFPLPRRERRILEYLVANRGRRVTKSQMFNAIYGIFDEEVEENVVESHISKLRKKLRKRLGYDPIDSKRSSATASMATRPYVRPRTGATRLIVCRISRVAPGFRMPGLMHGKRVVARSATRHRSGGDQPAHQSMMNRRFTNVPPALPGRGHSEPLAREPRIFVPAA